MARRWKVAAFAEADDRLKVGVALAPPGEDRLTSRTSRNRFLAVPVIRGGGVVARRTRPGRSLPERSLFSLTSRSCIDARGMDIHLRSGSRQSGWLFLKSKLCGGVCVRLPPTLELTGGGDVHLLIDFGCPRPGSRHERRGHLGESREHVLDERVGQGEV